MPWFLIERDDPPILAEPLQPEWSGYLAPMLVTELELECGLELTWREQ
jgi:hypothetical protein